MPTPAERQALLFLAGVIGLGAGVRVVRAARSDNDPDTASRHALARQLAAVDSARTYAGGAKSRRPRATRGKGERPNARRGVPTPESGRAPVASAAIPPATPSTPIDLDVASEADIETLPRIGPALARRIVEDREKNGAFGSLDGFERVRGVGPSLAAAVRERVTFSGTARPSNAVVDYRLRSPPPVAKSPRRERRPQ
jgi:DNA uptake protein ComE-like DNA-binding protein